MATERYHVCINPRHKTWVPRLFDALQGLANGTPTGCPRCRRPTHLELEFQFGLGEHPHLAKVLAAFLPKPPPRRWREGHYMRAFYPFLVIAESKRDRRRGIWLPYWHVDESKSGRTRYPKFGQWAPFISQPAFQSLVRQARACGYKV